MEFERLVIGCTRKAFRGDILPMEFSFLLQNHLDGMIKRKYIKHTRRPTFFFIIPLIAYGGRLCSPYVNKARYMYVFIYDFACAFSIQPSISNDAFEFMENFTAEHIINIVIW